MLRTSLTLFGLVLILTMTACSSAGAAGSAVEPARTPADSSSGAAAAAAPTAAASSNLATPLAPGQIRYVFAPQGNQAHYQVREQLAKRSFPSDAIGTTSAISGQIVLQSSGALVPDQSKIVVDLTTLQSDESMRDNYIRRNTLHTSSYPTAEFVPTQIVGLPSPAPTSGDVTFQLVGNMTVHGVTRPTTWQVTAHISGQDLTGTATTNFKFEDFGMTVPKVFVVLSVDDAIKLQMDFHMVRQ